MWKKRTIIFKKFLILLIFHYLITILFFKLVIRTQILEYWHTLAPGTLGQGGDRWVKFPEESLDFHPRFFPVFEEKREN